MRNDSYVVEIDEDFWILHVFDIQGEDDVLAIQLRLRSREECEAFPDDFGVAMVQKSKSHPVASGCPECRPSDRDLWTSMFTDWVKDAYSAMPTPPCPVDSKDVPEVVRLSMECVYNQDDTPEMSFMN
jgi:hypothetical protein